jgi:hypothetical protein
MCFARRVWAAPSIMARHEQIAAEVDVHAKVLPALGQLLDIVLHRVGQGGKVLLKVAWKGHFASVAETPSAPIGRKRQTPPASDRPRFHRNLRRPTPITAPVELPRRYEPAPRSEGFEDGRGRLALAQEAPRPVEQPPGIPQPLVLVSRPIAPTRREPRGGRPRRSARLHRHRHLAAPAARQSPQRKRRTPDPAAALPNRAIRTRNAQTR